MTKPGDIAEMSLMTAHKLDLGLVQSVGDPVTGYANARYKDFPVEISPDVPDDQVDIVRGDVVVFTEKSAYRLEAS